VHKEVKTTYIEVGLNDRCLDETIAIVGTQSSPRVAHSTSAPNCLAEWGLSRELYDTVTDLLVLDIDSWPVKVSRKDYVPVG